LRNFRTRNLFRSFRGPLAIACAVLAAGFFWKSHAGQAAAITYTGVSVQPSQQIFAVMCALDAAGFGADEDTLSEMPARLALRADLLKIQGPTADAIRLFYRTHAMANSAETLSRYIAFALAVGPPPSFSFQMDRDLLPPDVVSIEDFQPLLANFSKAIHLDNGWARVVAEYEPAVAKLQGPVQNIVTIANGYTRTLSSQSYGTTFTVFVEPLVGTRTVFRNFGDHYSIVVGAGSVVPTDDIRHAYLHFLLDPLPLRDRLLLNKKGALLDVAARAPQLPPEYQNDFDALADECLVKAVELRMRKLPPDQTESVLKEDDQSGFILVRTFFLELLAFEKQPLSLSAFFPAMVSAINVDAERKRLQSVDFIAAPPLSGSTHAVAPAAGQTAPLDSLLAQGDHQIAMRDALGAVATFENILKQYPGEPRATYGLAVASILSGDGERAKELFERLVSPGGPVTSEGQSKSILVEASDSSITAWSHVYLGRLYDVEGDRDVAVGEYKAALAVTGAPESARVAAQRGADAPYAPTAAPAEDSTQKP